MTNEEKKIIELYANQEAELSTLYHGYSFQFDDSSFWNKISKEESIHQSWILALSQDNQHLQFDQEHLSQADRLEEMIKYIKNMQSEQKNHDKLKALSIASNIEKSLIEREFFKIYRTDSPNVQQVLNDLAVATKIHIAKVENELNLAKGLSKA